MMNGYLLSWDARYLVERSKNQCKIGLFNIFIMLENGRNKNDKRSSGIDAWEKD